MPSGYTASIYEGENPTFSEFIMRCARGMGALITMRDEAPDAPIPDEFKPHTSYHDEAIAKARTTIEKLTSMDDASADEAAAEEYAQGMAEWNKRQEKSRDLARRYRAMLAEVEAWQPPTPDHEGLKKFMREQLQESLRFDCQDDEFAQQWKPKRRSGPVWRDEKAAQAHRDIAYHSEERAKEVERTQARTDWVKALRESLPSGARIDGGEG